MYKLLLYNLEIHVLCNFYVYYVRRSTCDAINFRIASASMHNSSPTETKDVVFVLRRRGIHVIFISGALYTKGMKRNAEKFSTCLRNVSVKMYCIFFYFTQISVYV